jgi:hypothetical protein
MNNTTQTNEFRPPSISIIAGISILVVFAVLGIGRLVMDLDGLDLYLKGKDWECAMSVGDKSSQFLGTNGAVYVREEYKCLVMVRKPYKMSSIVVTPDSDMKVIKSE